MFLCTIASSSLGGMLATVTIFVNIPRSLTGNTSLRRKTLFQKGERKRTQRTTFRTPFHGKVFRNREKKEN